MVNRSSAFNQYVVESEDHSFITGKTYLWFTSKIWGVLEHLGLSLELSWGYSDFVTLVYNNVFECLKIFIVYALYMLLWATIANVVSFNNNKK